MSRFSKVSSIFGRDAFATMRYVTLLNVSEIRDISNDERKVPFKNDEYLASGTSSFRKACKSIIRDNKIQKSLRKLIAAKQLLQFLDGRTHYIAAAKYNQTIDIISNMWFGQELPVWEALVRHFSDIQKGITGSYVETVMPFHYVSIFCCLDSRLFFAVPAVCAEIFYRNTNRFQHIIQTIILQ